jgi:hypothetical protein
MRVNRKVFACVPIVESFTRLLLAATSFIVAVLELLRHFR